jgi:hypothetical protein
MRGSIIVILLIGVSAMEVDLRVGLAADRPRP